MSTVARRETPYGERFTLFAEVLWIGVLVAAGSLLVVTWPAAMAAGCAAVRRCVPDGPSPGTARRFVADFRAALPGGAAVGTVGLAVLGFLGADLRLAAAGGVPLFGALAVVVAGAAGAVVVHQVRMAAGWSTTGRWARPRRDPRGVAMLGGAVLVSAVCVWQLTILAPLVTGVLALAAVAVDRRPAPGALPRTPLLNRRRGLICPGLPTEGRHFRGAGNCANHSATAHAKTIR
ncbi:hypothetical protein ACTWJ8_15665 [Streptomyces sp. SDT5-1]|uniref:hypothetical protein n=1 Tax=Streptomyces sp. SDT5-1 TaxID=3406418 RepID=UPI003FCF71FC